MRLLLHIAGIFLPVFCRGAAPELFEGRVEILGVRKSAGIGNFGDRQRCIEEQSLGFIASYIPYHGTETFEDRLADELGDVGLVDMLHFRQLGDGYLMRIILTAVGQDAVEPVVLFHVEVLIKVLVAEPVEISHQYVYQLIGGSGHLLSASLRDIAFEKLIRQGEDYILDIVQGFLLVRAAVTALAGEKGVLQEFPVDVEVGQIQVEQQRDVLLMGVKVVDISAVHRKDLPGAYYGMLMAGHQADISTKTVDELQIRRMTVGMGAGYFVQLSLAGQTVDVIDVFFCDFHDVIIL